jgi:sugar phosphate isomerase/epimerase
MLGLARKLGVEFLIGWPPRDLLNGVAKLCDEFDVALALDPTGAGDGKRHRPDELRRQCEALSPRIGVCADISDWRRSGLDPQEAVRALGPRLSLVRMSGEELNDLRWLEVMAKLGLRPALFAWTTGATGPEPDARTDAAIREFERITLRLAGATGPAGSAAPVPSAGSPAP